MGGFLLVVGWIFSLVSAVVLQINIDIMVLQTLFA